MRPTGRTLLLAAGGLALALLPALGAPRLWLLWLVWCALLAVAVGADAALAPRRGATVELAAPGRLRIGAPAAATVTVTLPVPWPVPATVLAETGPTGAGHRIEPPAPVHLLAGRTPATVEIELVPLRRGAAGIAELWLRWRGPLGLIRRTLRRPVDHRIEIVPDLQRVSGQAIQFFGSRDAAAGVKIERFAGDGSEFDSLREYTAGLDPRSIHWKASARHTRLLSRDVRAERNHHIVLAVDTGRLMAEPVSGAPLLDHAIHSALLLALVSLRSGDRVSLYSFDERPRAMSPPRGGLAAFQGLVGLTRALEYTQAETNFTLALTHLAAGLRRRSLVVVLTDFVDSVTAELMVDNVLRLNRRHLVLFAAFRDPLLDEVVAGEPAHLLDVDRALVAASLVREREVVLRRLRKQGVHALDALPDRLGPRLINRYLEIKRRELI